MRRFTELTRTAKGDPAVRSIMERWCESTGLTLSEMARDEPEEFDYMIEAIDDFLAQSPEDERPDWSGD